MARYFTPYRYVVFAKLMAARLTSQSLASAAPRSSDAYHADIPPWIISRYPLWLSENSLPMGTLNYRGVLSERLALFVHSPAPLDITPQAIRLLEAYRYTSQHRQLSWLRSIIPSVAPSSDPFWGAKSVAFRAPVRLTMALGASDRPTGLVLLAPNVTVDGQAQVLQFTYQIIGPKIHLVEVTTYR
ncbi:hypothetical protein [Sulfobacillus harzensis]|uniref:Uncharacterized protein n=1 Tax=Sulfobacillus harzensis TaxID=2729629 RepID=A0A7Y0Q1S3_9FIRM|nr:hypothetical protein [Sulfobacillus harzensis]NMP22398.1 hypothetical protein [Sulfobacillus harzensis]